MTISAVERATLVALARAALEAEVTGGVMPAANLSGVLGESRGCFVTVTNQGRLRGCIGTFQPRGALGELVIEMGQAAARDPRFIYYNPITPKELGALKVEVSVLSPLEETSDPLALDIGRHGIFIIRGHASGCFLPEVATDQGWDARQFLDECCSGKAGLPRNAWQMTGTKVYLFTSEKFSE
jgi:uncharacterized protein